MNRKKLPLRENASSRTEFFNTNGIYRQLTARGASGRRRHSGVISRKATLLLAFRLLLAKTRVGRSFLNMTLNKYVFVWLGIVLATVSTASAEWKEKVLYSFQGGTDGATPVGSVVFDKAGNLYGATQNGGSASCRSIEQCGTVYQLAPPAKQGDPWTETVLYVFTGNASDDGASPYGGLVIDNVGNLYGTTGYGGTGDCVLLGSKLGCGTVFELSPPKQKSDVWTETVLYSFPTAKRGYVPVGDLVFDSAGNLYGATLFGGGFGTTCDPFYQYCGTVFQLSPPKQKGGKWTEKVLHGFKGGTDGGNPNGGLLLDSKGAIYGTTFAGGNQNCKYSGSVGCGSAFRLNPPARKSGAWSEKDLHVFTGGNDGGQPIGGLIFDAKGSLYGTAGGGRPSGGGIVFRLTESIGRPWKENVLHWFSNSGPGPSQAGLILDAVGDLYGTTSGGDSERGGSVFRLKPPTGKGAWSLDLLYAFTGSPDGAYPAAPLIFDNGSLYGTTQVGGTGQSCQGGCGTVFEVSP
jgi:hypothetical protein